ncbi:MAG: gliding motility-associated C-terminal domain-containing protein [Elusimicrobiota bacterium]|nr:gliding motility-associated C-terminal domain-containing protein [Elusimicrobiota bacterium]
MNSSKMIMAGVTALALALFGAASLRAQQGGFRFFGPLARVLTPNGDGINDRLLVCYDNFSDSGVSGRIYTVLGAEVASLTHVRSVLPGCAPGILTQHAVWDGTANGVRVRSGLYVYRIEAEGKTHAGTFLVVR